MGLVEINYLTFYTKCHIVYMWIKLFCFGLNFTFYFGGIMAGLSGCTEKPIDPVLLVELEEVRNKVRNTKNKTINVVNSIRGEYCSSPEGTKEPSTPSFMQKWINDVLGDLDIITREISRL